MRRVLIAGCGYVGSALAGVLAADGHRVFAVRRDADGLPGEVVPVVADLTAPASLTDLPPDLDAVAYTASPDGRDEADYRAAYLDGVSNLLEALAAAGQQPQRVVLTTSTAVYGQTDGSWVDETTVPRPPTATAAVLVEAEQRLAAGPFPGVVLRLGGIYGAGRTRLVARVRDGRAACTEGPPVYSNRIHRDDAAGALQHLLSLPQPDPVYLGVDDDPADRCEVLRFLADRLGVPPPPVRPGRAGRPGNKRCRNRRLRSSGYRLRYPSYRDGYGELLARQR